MTSTQDPVFFFTIQARDVLGEAEPISFYDIQPTAASVYLYLRQAIAEKSPKPLSFYHDNARSMGSPGR